MPTDPQLIFAGAEAALADLYALPVHRAKRPVAGGKPPLGGWNPGWKLPCFVLSMPEAEGVDDHGSFEEESVRYALCVEYVKSAGNRIDGTPPVNGTDPNLVEDEDVREKRAAVRARFYKPTLGGMPAPIDFAVRPGRPYDLPGTGPAPVVVSGQTFTYELGEPRPE